MARSDLRLTQADFVAGPGNNNKSAIDAFQAKGYSFATNATSLAALPTDQRALGLFTQGNMRVLLALCALLTPSARRGSTRRSTRTRSSSRPTLSLARAARGAHRNLWYALSLGSNVLDQPTLTNMTLKAIDSASAHAPR